MQVLVFPGEGSCTSEVMDRARARCSAAPGVLDEVGAVLGDRVEGRVAAYESTEAFSPQLTVFIANHLRWLGRKAEYGDTCSVGLGVGEFNHLIHIGALSFADALRLVAARARAFDRGPHGCRVAVTALGAARLRSVLEDVDGFVAFSEFRGPQEHVIGGEADAVREAKARLRRHGARCTVVDRRFPVHTDLFEPVAARFERALWRARWRAPRRPYIPNVRGEPLPGASALDFVAALRAHVHRPVLWASALDWIAQALPGARNVAV